MKKNIYLYFIFSLLLGTSIYFISKMNIQLPKIVRFYVNDFLIIPIVLIPVLLILKWSKNDEKYQISIWIILYACALYAFLFEYILPQFHPRYTADIIDVILYFISGFIFFILQKPKN